MNVTGGPEKDLRAAHQAAPDQFHSVVNQSGGADAESSIPEPQMMRVAIEELYIIVALVKSLGRGD
eukprot:922367-Karenia_brevis.AAC.1